MDQPVQLQVLLLSRGRPSDEATGGRAGEEALKDVTGRGTPAHATSIRLVLPLHGMIA
jgi:hypothetical protein